MTAPQRIQLRRTKGWRKPEGAVVVARPSKWGNPFAAKIPRGEAGLATMARETLVREFRTWLLTECWVDPRTDRLAACWDSGRVDYLGVPYEGRPSVDDIRAELAGKDLACWCPLDQPCHADVLLDVANRSET